MGNQQLLMLTLTTVLVSIAVAVGIGMVKDSDFDSVGNEIQQHLLFIANEAYAYSLKPASLGGGSGKINTFTLSENSRETPNAIYSISQTQKTGIGIVARSKRPDYAGALVILLGFDPTPQYNTKELKMRFFGSGVFKKYTTEFHPFIQ